MAPTLTLPRTLTRTTCSGCANPDPDPDQERTLTLALILSRWRALLSLTLGVVLISSETSPASAVNVC